MLEFLEKNIIFVNILMIIIEINYYLNNFHDFHYFLNSFNDNYYILFLFKLVKTTENLNFKVNAVLLFLLTIVYFSSYMYVYNNFTKFL